MYRELLFYAFAFSAFVPIYQAYQNPKKLYELPCLYGIACYVFVIPTLFFVKDNSYLLTDSQFNRYLLNAIICFWAGIVGYHSYRGRHQVRSDRRSIVYSDNKIFITVMPLILLGGYASLQIDPTEFGSELGGVFAIVLFCSRLLRPAIVILFTTYLMRPNSRKLIVLLLYFLLSLQFIIISGRRSEVFNLVVTVIFPLFFIKRVIVPRPLIIPAIIGVIFLVAVLPVAREFTKRGEYDKLLNLSLTEISTTYLSGERTNEVIEAAVNMEVMDQEENYNYGVSLYNSLIHQYASATIFGRDFKNSLYVNRVDLGSLRDKYFWIGETGGYKGYLSYTGFAAAFYEFGFFGFLLFFLFGRLTKVFWTKAINGEDIFWIIFYCCFATFILFSIYHSITAIPTIFLPMLLILAVVMKLSRSNNSIIRKKYA